MDSCTDNGSMEGFWGILNYGRRFTCREKLTNRIRDYIAYYNFRPSSVGWAP